LGYSVVVVVEADEVQHKKASVQEQIGDGYYAESTLCASEQADMRMRQSHEYA
jgi:hypothetical protein